MYRSIPVSSTTLSGMFAESLNFLVQCQNAEKHRQVRHEGMRLFVVVSVAEMPCSLSGDVHMGPQRSNICVLSDQNPDM